jgi:hypothetical protein
MNNPSPNMTSLYLSKSDFTACRDCRTKLFYRKSGYPSALDDDEYLRLLADGGFMVEYIAKSRFPDGIDLAAERDAAAASQRTKDLLASGDVTLFEAAVTAGRFHVRTDILRRDGNVLHLIEVKSSSLGDEDDVNSPFLTKKGTVEARWREYVMDVAFQTHVLRLAFPRFQVQPQLCVVDKRHPVTEAETLGRFALEKDSTNPRSRPRIIYHGDVASLAESKLVCFRPVEQEVGLMMPEVIQKAEALAALLSPDGGVTRFQEDIADLYQQCRVCEYRVQAEAKSGFRECWRRLADAAPHILDLHRVGQIGSAKSPDPVPALLRRGRASLLDLDEGDLGAEGTFQQRRLMQWQAMRRGGVEHLPAALRRELEAHQRAPGWPLHFVDFEACDVALPHHAGLRPYERVAFQWSCHTVAAAGQLTHAEWLNIGRDFPNFAFALSLRERLGERGTVYTWSPYEQATLRRVLLQIGEWVQRDPEEAARVASVPDAAALQELAAWLNRLLGSEGQDGRRRSPRIRDLHELARQHYFHPLMGGRTSIKVVLPAVWEADAALRQHPWFAAYHKVDAAGRPLDPYRTLPALPIGGDNAGEDAVREGTGAVRVYQEMTFGAAQSPGEQASRRQLLLQYCQLDTAAMVMTWRHWLGRAAPPS